jgi:hypothetical protein
MENEAAGTTSASASGTRSDDSQRLEQPPAGVVPEVSTARAGWLFPWLDAGGWEAFASFWRMPQLVTGGSGARTAKAISEQPLEAPGAPEDIEPPPSSDRLLHAAMGRLTAGLSPAALALAYADWAVHLWSSPGTQ